MNWDGSGGVGLEKNVFETGPEDLPVSAFNVFVL